MLCGKPLRQRQVFRARRNDTDALNRSNGARVIGTEKSRAKNADPNHYFNIAISDQRRSLLSPRLPCWLRSKMIVSLPRTTTPSGGGHLDQDRRAPRAMATVWFDTFASRVPPNFGDYSVEACKTIRAYVRRVSLAEEQGNARQLFWRQQKVLPNTIVGFVHPNHKDQAHSFIDGTTNSPSREPFLLEMALRDSDRNGNQFIDR